MSSSEDTPQPEYPANIYPDGIVDIWHRLEDRWFPFGDEDIPLQRDVHLEKIRKALSDEQIGIIKGFPVGVDPNAITCWTEQLLEKRLATICGELESLRKDLAQPDRPPYHLKERDFHRLKDWVEFSEDMIRTAHEFIETPAHERDQFLAQPNPLDACTQHPDL